MTLSKEEKEYILNILRHQQEKVKKFEKSPDDYFQAFGKEVKIDEFLTGLIDKIKNL